MRFTSKTENDLAVITIIDSLLEHGFEPVEPLPRRSTHKFMKEADGIRQVVLLNVKEMKTEIFRGAFVVSLPDTKNTVRWNSWRVCSARKQQEVLHKIVGSTPSVNDTLLPYGEKGR